MKIELRSLKEVEISAGMESRCCGRHPEVERERRDDPRVTIVQDIRVEEIQGKIWAWP